MRKRKKYFSRVQTPAMLTMRLLTLAKHDRGIERYTYESKLPCFMKSMLNPGKKLLQALCRGSNNTISTRN
jgi:DNA-binding HxlR family transcriptional regulator